MLSRQGCALVSWKGLNTRPHNGSLTSIKIRKAETFHPILLLKQNVGPHCLHSRNGTEVSQHFLSEAEIKFKITKAEFITDKNLMSKQKPDIRSI